MKRVAAALLVLAFVIAMALNLLMLLASLVR